MKGFFKCFTALCVAVLMVISNVSAYEFAEIRQESDENIIELEAENFVRGAGFKIIDDETASGGKCIVGEGNQNEKIEFDLSFDTEVKLFVIYAVHKAESKKGNLSYIAINHFENYSLYDYEIGKWNQTRLFYGDLNRGNYTIKLTSVRAGQKIDKLIIKYSKFVSNQGNTLTSNPIDESKYTYIPGKEEYGNLNVTEVKETVYGSFMFEVEDGNISNKTRIGYDENASGGKYWYAPHDEKLPHLTEHTMTDEIFSRFKFKVNHKGNYVMWIRYNTPNASQKSTWFGIDNDNYYRLDDNFTMGWEWVKSSTVRYLDVGWHTLDIKYRQPGQKIDCVILTDVAGYTAQGMGSLPGEPVKFDANSWAIIDKVAAMSKFKTNNFRAKSDCPFVITKKDMLVPATNLFNTMAIDLEEYEDYYIAKQGRNYIKFYMDSDRVIINGTAKHTGVKAYRYQGAIPMVQLSAAKEAFDFDYEYNERESTLNIYYDFAEDYREAQEGEINIRPYERFFFYDIPCDDPNAKVEVWFKYNLTDTLVLSRMNYDNMNTIKNGGIDYKSVNSEWSYWRKAMPPVYKDGAFHGSEQAQNVEPYDVKVRIVKDGKEDIFVKRNAFKPQDTVYTVELSAQEYAYKTNGELLLVPTFENISYYIDFNEPDLTCEILYRIKGTENWKKAYTPYKDNLVGQFRGSIVFCKEDTEYEVMARLKNSAGSVVAEKMAEVKTWTSDPPIAKTIKLSEIYSGEGPLLLQSIKGKEDGWIRITGDENMDTVNGTKQYNQAVLISDCKYLIFENIKVRGGDRHCINIHGGSENVRILNCDIAEWGHEGILDEDFGGYAYRGYFQNNLAGIFFYNTKNIVIERCYIHDCDIRTNPWDTDTYKNVHPKGGTGIQMLGKGGIVIRYNDIIGSDKHRFNDVMEGTNNRGRDSGSIGPDADVYGNMMIYSEDDSIELDGGQMNVRVYYNRMEQSRCGVSTAPNTMGPSYIFYNQIVNLGGTYNNASGTAIKAGGSPDKVFGLQYYFNNTIDSDATGPKNISYGDSSEFHSVSRNNIFVTRIGSRVSFSNIYADERDDNDYDLLGGGPYVVKEGDESHGIVGMPTYVDRDRGIYYLAEGSLGKASGIYIDNFTEIEKPDMGAYPSGDEKFQMPFRPVPMYADVSYIQMKDKEEKEVTIQIGDIGEGHTYSILKNRDFNWLDILSENGTDNVSLSPNSIVKFKIKGDLSKCEFKEGKGLVLFRLENGYSVPITVYCTR